MATQKQIEANRRNAQRSTGPTSEAGKAASRFNSLKHGMTAATAVLPYEDAGSYYELRGTLLTHYQPASPAETMLVELVANNYWRLLRARRAETAILTLGIEGLKKRNDIDPAPNVNDDDNALGVFIVSDEDAIRQTERYQSNIERSYFRSLEALRKAQNDRRREERLTTASAAPTPKPGQRPFSPIPEIGFVSQPTPAPTPKPGQRPFSPISILPDPTTELTVKSSPPPALRIP